MGNVACNHTEPEQSEDQGLEQGFTPVETGNADEEQKKQRDETL